MKLSREEVAYVAGLAGLTLSHEERARFREQLSSVLAHAACLEELDVEDVPSARAAPPLHSALRPDEASPPFAREDLLANAPIVERDCFVVPPIADSASKEEL
jgi:aspartyl-tRNA(Asn)/glutamyl-tRNA(Gln) amidotransferase subunit C